MQDEIGSEQLFLRKHIFFKCIFGDSSVRFAASGTQDDLEEMTGTSVTKVVTVVEACKVPSLNVWMEFGLGLCRRCFWICIGVSHVTTRAWWHASNFVACLSALLTHELRNLDESLSIPANCLVLGQSTQQWRLSPTKDTWLPAWAGNSTQACSTWAKVPATIGMKRRSNTCIGHVFCIVDWWKVAFADLYFLIILCLIYMYVCVSRHCDSDTWDE